MGHFSRECKDRKAGDEVRYSTYQQSQVEAGTSKAGSSKALVTVDDHVNWTVHEPDEASGLIKFLCWQAAIQRISMIKLP